MNAAHSPRRRLQADGRAELRLPEIDERQIPAWAITQRAVTITMAIFGCVALAAIVTLAVGSFEIAVDANGIIEPAVVVPVRPLVAGTVASVLVRSGDIVTVGQPLLQLDTVAAAASVRDVREQLEGLMLQAARIRRAGPIEREHAAATLAEAEARASRARTALRSTMATYSITGDLDSIVRATGSRVHIGLDGAAADYLAAEASARASRSSVATAELFPLDLAQKQVEIGRLRVRLFELESDLARMTIVAPTTGTVLSDQPERLLHAAMSAGQTALEVADLHKWQANLAVKEVDVHRVQVSDHADVEIPALSSTNVDHLRGQVVSVGWQSGPAAASSEPGSNAAGYRLVVDLDSTDIASLRTGILRRGYVARAKIVTQSASALTILLGRTKQQMANLRR